MMGQVLSAIAGIELFPIISLLIFFVVFLGVLVSVARLDPTHLERMGALPLDPTGEGSDLAPKGGTDRV